MSQFPISEDDLTNAIFNGSALPLIGSGTKAEAREQARKMLAALDTPAPARAASPPTKRPRPAQFNMSDALDETPRQFSLI